MHQLYSFRSPGIENDEICLIDRSLTSGLFSRNKIEYMYIAESAEDVQVGCNSELHAGRQSSDN